MGATSPARWGTLVLRGAGLAGRRAPLTLRISAGAAPSDLRPSSRVSRVVAVKPAEIAVSGRLHREEAAAREAPDGQVTRQAAVAGAYP